MEQNRREELISIIPHWGGDYFEALKKFTETISVDELTEWMSRGYKNELTFDKFPFPHTGSHGEHSWDYVFKDIVRAIKCKPNNEQTYAKMCSATANVFKDIETDYSKIAHADKMNDFIGLTTLAGNIFAYLKNEDEYVKNYVEQSPELKKLEEVVGKFARINNTSEESRAHKNVHAKSLFLYGYLQKNNFDSEFWEDVFKVDDGCYAYMSFTAMSHVDLDYALAHMPGLVAAQTKYPDMVDLDSALFYLYDEKSDEAMQKTNNCIVEAFKGIESTEVAKAFAKEYRKFIDHYNIKIVVDERLFFNV